MTARRYDEACAKFQESDTIEPSAGAKLNLGECEYQRGKLATAWELFGAAMARMAPDDPRLPVATGRLRELETKVPRLTLGLAPGAPGDTTVRMGQAELGAQSFGVPLPLDPGMHELVVAAAGRAPRPLTVTLREA